MVSKKVDYKPSLREGATNWFTLLTGGIFPMLRKIAGNPKHLIRILGTETGARLFGYIFSWAAFETFYDFLMMAKYTTYRLF